MRSGFLCKRAVFFLSVTVLVAGSAYAAPVIVESGWELTRTVDFDSPQAARYNPVDGLVYAGTRGRAGGDGIFRIHADGAATQLVSASSVSGLAIDPSDGDIFFSEDYGGYVFRVGFGETARSTWVSGFDTGDDDPVGLTILGDDAYVVDRGAGSADEIWKFSPVTPENEVEIPDVDPLLIDPTDIAAGPGGIYIVDDRDSSDGMIFRLNGDDTLTEIALQTVIKSPVALTVDPVSGDLFVLDYDANRLVRVDPATGAVSDMFTGFDLYQGSWAGVDITPDGRDIIVTDDGNSAIYTFTATQVPAPSAFWLLAGGLLALLPGRRRDPA